MKSCLKTWILQCREKCEPCKRDALAAPLTIPKPPPSATESHSCISFPMDSIVPTRATVIQAPLLSKHDGTKLLIYCILNNQLLQPDTVENLVPQTIKRLISTNHYFSQIVKNTNVETRESLLTLTEQVHSYYDFIYSKIDSATFIDSLIKTNNDTVFIQKILKHWTNLSSFKPIEAETIYSKISSRIHNRLNTDQEIEDNMGILELMLLLIRHVAKNITSNTNAHLQTTRLLLALNHSPGRISNLKPAISGPSANKNKVLLLWILWTLNRTNHLDELLEIINPIKPSTPFEYHMLWIAWLLMENEANAMQAYAAAKESSPDFFKDDSDSVFDKTFMLRIAALKLGRFEFAQSLSAKAVNEPTPVEQKAEASPVNWLHLPIEKLAG